LVRVEPGKVEFRQGGDAAGDVVIVDMEARELMQKRQSDDTTSGDLLDAGEIVGMEVDLADTESFGEVEDVMIAEDGREAVALVVDNWDGVNKQRRALPVALDSVDREDESIRYDFGRDALGEAGDFDLDQYTDDTM
ncbi:MAG TPA: PRC-barrel domain-containing protein, partial [Gammaproteobacteria bacterium]